ncbi:MAG: TonB family protein [Alphaproteobacteria bacterium]|nr:TonB family protein [Alphaproteobacteria bacterium]
MVATGCRLIVAAIAIAAASSAAAETKPTEVITVIGVGAKPGAVDATVEMHGDDRFGGNFVAVWPKAAYQRRTDGEVTLTCLVDIHGLAEQCSVASETPANLGFGDAALALRTTLKVTPAHAADASPIAAPMNIRVRFKAPETFAGDGGGSSASLPNSDNPTPPPVGMAVFGNALQMRDVTMMNNPVWVSAASVADLAQAYPAEAHGVEGYAVAHCHVMPTGELDTCQIIKETPDKIGFKAAALSLTGKFRVKPELARRPAPSPIWVDIPMRFPAPSAAPPTVAAPLWLVKYDPTTTSAVFPQAAIARGLTQGTGTARCTVGPDGALIACGADGSDPDGFSHAAAELASVMRMNLWSADASPVIGAQVVLPIEIKRN